MFDFFLGKKSFFVGKKKLEKKSLVENWKNCFDGICFCIKKKWVKKAFFICGGKTIEEKNVCFGKKKKLNNGGKKFWLESFCGKRKKKKKKL